ncbi:MAG: hypothetical protein AB8G11_23160 [Saprospiraceae bacterium]
MKYLIQFLIYINIVLIISCSPQNISKYAEEELSKLDSVDRDNQIYTVGTKLLFDYYVIDKNQDTTKVLLLNDMPSLIASSWVLVNPDTVTNTDFLIDKIHVEIKDESLYKNSPYEPQTQIQFDYLIPSKKSIITTWTGIIEDKNRIWWHPPRSAYFFSTEFSPFPEIRFPLKKGTKWTGKIKAGYNTEAKEWIGNDYTEKTIDIHSTYEITDKTKIQTAFGELKCYVVEATGTSQVTEAKLTAYFHPTIGFVKWDYHNLDGTRLVISLISREE